MCAKLLRPKEVLLDVSDGSERTVNAKKLVNLSVCKGDSLGNIDALWQHFFPQHCRCGIEAAVHYDSVIKLEDFPEMLSKLATQGVIRKGHKSFLMRRVNAHGRLHNINSYFSIPLFDALCKVRTEEINQLNYTQGVGKLRKALVAHQRKHAALFDGMEQHFTNAAECAAAAARGGLGVTK